MILISCLLLFFIKIQPRKCRKCRKCINIFAGEDCKQCVCAKGDCQRIGKSKWRCICNKGYVGEFCDTTDPTTCINGSIPFNEPGNCVCDPGWTGDRCNIPPFCTSPDDCNTDSECIANRCVPGKCAIPSTIQFIKGLDNDNHSDIFLIEKYCKILETHTTDTEVRDDVTVFGVRSTDDLRNICNKKPFSVCSDHLKAGALQHIWKRYHPLKPDQ
jgi:hypothetical protein